MQDLLQTLQDHDIGHLAAVAELWGLDLPPGPALEAARGLAQAMLDPEQVREVVETLPPDARRALEDLLRRGGRMPFLDFTRRHGPLREMGPARRDRERPWREPASPTEALWYRGLIARAFADTPAGPQEFVFVPRDLLPLLPTPPPAPEPAPGHPAPEPAHVTPASHAAVEDATTLLAALRARPEPAPSLHPDRLARLARFLQQPPAAPLLLTLLAEQEVLSGPPLAPDPEAARLFLDLPAPQAAAHLLRAWRDSFAWNDLAHTPGLSCPEGTWPNDPRLARRALVAWLQRIPPGAWWDLESLVAFAHETEPAFQRPGGDFDSWYLTDGRGTFLRGFEHWHAVEGALLRYLLIGPLHWLGGTDLGAAEEGGPPRAFRLTPLAAALWREELDLPPPLPARARLHADGRLEVPAGVPPALRYQVARFTEWEGLKGTVYRYRLTARSLERGREAGLRPAHVRAVLEALAGGIPSTLERALERWAARGTEARLERPWVLRVTDPEVLRTLRRDRAVAPLLGPALGPTAVLVEARHREALRRAAARLGLLLALEDPEADDLP